MKFLVTGVAGFIGHSLAGKLLREGHQVVGIDSLNDYYDVNLKLARLKDLHVDVAAIDLHKKVASTDASCFEFVKMKLEDGKELLELCSVERFDVVINLAAQAGVRYSLENPRAYVDANIVGFLNVLEACRHYPVKHLIYASSSSVYGANKKMPFSTSDNVDHPVSLYAASKKSNELMAHTYSHLYGVPTTGLRFFTVYGPWGRPDMALFIFTKAILEGKPLKVFNYGKMKRDFTYVDDIVEGVYRAALVPPQSGETATEEYVSNAPYRVFNIGNSKAVNLMDFIRAIEKATGKEAVLEMLPMQPGDVPATYADVAALSEATGYKPDTLVEDGVANFVDWYRNYYQV
ncbi:NAD-dependent epimerase [Echinicola strongylocentroti]|uniref:NAD-dependent epimerase n=1 Tax=Echinicola strongylocentroti TaxID=1795355 RepID=A0A2Z4IM00_9BACT|nr:NAD-dependent epimerase [Echinicola strongylocentroti]AWW31737.1 NAD-dependent epimerase [Echinicola strongylocentroti]